MLLQKALVKILENYNLNNRDGITQEDFINEIMRGRLLAIELYKDKLLRSKVEVRIKDSINEEKKEGYMVENEGKIEVTRKGRDFIRLDGFIEEYFKKRLRTVRALFNVILGVVSVLVVQYLLDQWGILGA